MHCSDLERYLEACLDGQLGDSRRLALKEHLVGCRTCRERVEALRRFEADLQRRLRAMRHEASLWQPLELAGDRGGLDGPPRPPLPRKPLLLPRKPVPPLARGRHALRASSAAMRAPTSRRWLQHMAGGALLLAAFAALAELAISGLDRLGGGGRADIYRAYLDGTASLDLRTAEAGQLASWLGEKLGHPVSLPATPESFALVGGAQDGAGLSEGAAIVVYMTAAGPALLVIESAAPVTEPAALAPLLTTDDGLNLLAWREGGQAYSLISALPPDKLALFPAN